jgi:hypothetical protein
MNAMQNVRKQNPIIELNIISRELLKDFLQV